MAIFHGWLVVEESTPGFKDYFIPEYTDDNGIRIRIMNPEFRSPSLAVGWWDKRVGEPVKLLPLLKGCYRVYTGEL